MSTGSATSDRRKAASHRGSRIWRYPRQVDRDALGLQLPDERHLVRQQVGDPDRQALAVAPPGAGDQQPLGATRAQPLREPEARESARSPAGGDPGVERDVRAEAEDATGQDHQRRVWYPALRTAAWRTRDRGKPGLGSPPHGTPDRSVRGPPRAACRRHHIVPAPLACRGGRRRARRRGARCLPVRARPDARPRPLEGLRPDAWCPHRDDKGKLPEGVPPMLLQGQSALALSSDRHRGRPRESRARRQDRDDVTFDFETNERGDIFTLSVTAPTRSRRRTWRTATSPTYIDGSPPGGRRRVRWAARQRPARTSPRSRIASPRSRPSWDGSIRTCWPCCPTPPSPWTTRQRRRRRDVPVPRPPGVNADRDAAAGVRAAGPAAPDRGGEADLRAEQHRRHRAADLRHHRRTGRARGHHPGAAFTR